MREALERLQMTPYDLLRRYREETADRAAEVALEEAFWRIGWMTLAQLEDAATRLLSNGYDGEALTAIAAGLSDSWTAEKLWARALREMGQEPASRDEAGLRVAKCIAAEVVSGQLSPDAGVKLLARLYSDLDHPEWLSTFCALEDFLSYMTDKDNLRRDVIEAARRLLDTDIIVPAPSRSATDEGLWALLRRLARRLGRR